MNAGSGEESVDGLLTPEVLAGVDDALAGLGLNVAERSRESFTEITSWTALFGSTAGPFLGVGGAAMTNFRLTIVHSPVAMILFARSERFGPARLFGVAPFDESVITGGDWTAFTFIPAI